MSLNLKENHSFVDFIDFKNTVNALNLFNFKTFYLSFNQIELKTNLFIKITD
jgi:hypothetical protein